MKVVLHQWVEVDQRYEASFHTLSIEDVSVDGVVFRTLSHFWIPIDVYDGATCYVSYKAYTDEETQEQWHSRHRPANLVRLFQLEKVVASYGIDDLDALTPLTVVVQDASGGLDTISSSDGVSDDFYDHLISQGFVDPEDLNEHLHEVAQHFGESRNGSVSSENSNEPSEFFGEDLPEKVDPDQSYELSPDYEEVEEDLGIDSDDDEDEDCKGV